MKATGIVRKVDDLGRVVLPIELRRVLGINTKDSLEIFVDGNKVVLKKYERGCKFCGQNDPRKLIDYKEVAICADCAGDLIQAVNTINGRRKTA